MKTKVETNAIDQYIAAFPETTRQRLNKLREIIRKAAPDAEETISYKMPAYKQNGMLCFFAGYENHIGFYPTASGIAAFKKEIAVYKNSKGAVQFPLDKPLPSLLISKMVKLKINENKTKAK